MQEEIWKDIQGYEGVYAASNLGRIKSYAKKWVGGNNGLRTKPDTIRKQIISQSGYYMVILRSNNKIKNLLVHRIIYETFKGKIPKKNHIHHINNNKLDNMVENLDCLSVRDHVNITYSNKKKSSKYFGVSWKKISNKWQSHIRINGVLKNLGTFACEMEAAKAYENAVKNLLQHLNE